MTFPETDKTLKSLMLEQQGLTIKSYKDNCFWKLEVDTYIEAVKEWLLQKQWEHRFNEQKLLLLTQLLGELEK